RDLQGKPVVLFFYPEDDTPGCTREACAFRDDTAAFREIGAVVLGVSVQDEASHRAFRETYHLTFDLVSDSDKRISRAYNALGFHGSQRRRLPPARVHPLPAHGESPRHLPRCRPRARPREAVPRGEATVRGRLRASGSPHGNRGVPDVHRRGTPPRHE